MGEVRPWMLISGTSGAGGDRQCAMLQSARCHRDTLNALPMTVTRKGAEFVMRQAVEEKFGLEAAATA